MYHNTFAAPNVKVDFIGNNDPRERVAGMGLTNTNSATQFIENTISSAVDQKLIRQGSASLSHFASMQDSAQQQFH